MNARFARTFTGGFSFSLDYRNINNLGDFRYQRVKHNALAVGGWLPVGERYDAFLIFTKNTSKQQENGGFRDPQKIAEGATAIDLDVWLRDGRALSRHADWDMQLVQHLKLVGAAKKDSSGREIKAAARTLRLTHALTWGNQNYKFADANLNTDKTFFDTFLVDERGLRHFIGLKKVENAFVLTTFKPKGKGLSSDVLSVGITHTYYSVNQELRNTAFSNLFLNGNIGITPSERFYFKAKGDLGLLKNIGEYYLNGDLKIGLGKAGEFRAALQSQRYPPALLPTNLFISRRVFWENDFKKPIDNTLSAAYALPRLGFEAMGRAHLLNNYIYYDALGFARQTGVAVQVVQLVLRENLRLGHLHIDNTVALQKNNRSSVLHLPEWFSKNSLYFSGKIFKKNMLLEAGADVRINGEFQPDGYQPLTWQFHLQDTFSQKPYLWVDAFLAFKIANFRVFARFENVSKLWNGNQALFLTNRYAQPFPAFRLGIRWRFMDSNVPEAGDTGVGNGAGSDPGLGGGRPRF